METSNRFKMCNSLPDLNQQSLGSYQVIYLVIFSWRKFCLIIGIVVLAAEKKPRQRPVPQAWFPRSPA